MEPGSNKQGCPPLWRVYFCFRQTSFPQRERWSAFSKDCSLPSHSAWLVPPPVLRPTSVPTTAWRSPPALLGFYLSCSFWALWLHKKDKNRGWKSRTVKNSSSHKRKSGLGAWGGNSPQRFNIILSVLEWTGYLILLVSNGSCQRKNCTQERCGHPPEAFPVSPGAIYEASSWFKTNLFLWFWIIENRNINERISMPDNGSKLTWNTAESNNTLQKTLHIHWIMLPHDSQVDWHT